MSALRLFVLLMGSILLGWSSIAAAHLTPNSEVQLAVGDSAVTADIIVPQGEYAYATDNPVDSAPISIARAQRYLASHMAVTTLNGRPWRVQVDKPEFFTIAGPPDLHATAILTPPPGATTSAFTVRWTVLIDALPNHFALFVATTNGEREIIGAVRSGSETIEVRESEGPFAVLASAVALGAQHIATGYDHLLFLFALLLPAPLIAAYGRWSRVRPMGGAIRLLAKIVTAFTIGHSITLVGATLGGWRLPPAPVEILIALSVLISAIHAIRPIFPGREPLIAGAFGLVHGLAFATLVQNAGAGLRSSALGLFGFNLGIELVQLALVLTVMPPLIVMSRWPAYARFRTVCGIACAVLASLWVVERALPSTGIGSAGPATTTMAVLAVVAILSVVAFARSAQAQATNTERR